MLSSAFNAGFWTILFWIFVGIAVGGLISWLLGRSSETATTAADDRLGLANFEGKTVRIREDRVEVADELQAIEGVGPQISELFHKNGIHRFHQIASMSPGDITHLLKWGGSKFDIANPFTWPFQAKLLAAGLIAEHFDLRERLTAGRLPLTGIKGLGPATADRLAAFDLGSVEALAAAHAAEVAAKLKSAGEPVEESVVAGWIDHARGIGDGDANHLAEYFGIPIAKLTGRPAVTFTESREVTGPLIDASALVGSATATATAAPSLLPVWLGLGGAALLALLSALGLRGPSDREAVVADGPRPAGVSALAAELGTDTTFETDSAVLTAAGRAEIDSKVIDPARDLQVSSVRIVGHADVRGDDASNLTLSRDRARSVANYMREKVRAEGISWNPRVIEVYGAGEEFPNPNANTQADCSPLDPASEQASACYAPDRRVDVTILVRGEQSEVEAAEAAADAAN